MRTLVTEHKLAFLRYALHRQNGSLFDKISPFLNNMKFELLMRFFLTNIHIPEDAGMKEDEWDAESNNTKDSKDKANQE